MIIKMIKNLENKMEKIIQWRKQESINKDLKELKNKHTETNHTITEIKNTLEGINSRISEAEEWISEMEDKMVEILLKSRIKYKEWKELRIVSETSGTISNAPIWIIEVPEEEEKNKGHEKIFEEIIVENFTNMEKEIVNQVQEAQSPIQDKSKEKHAKTHVNQTDKD